MAKYDWYQHKPSFEEHNRARGARDVLNISLEPPLDIICRQYQSVKLRNVEPSWGTLAHLWNFRNRNSTEPVDKVFAIRELCTDLEPDDLKANYSLEPQKVFINTARTLIKRDKDLRVLGACQLRSNHPGLPTWVPDWTVGQELRPIRTLTTFIKSERAKTYHALYPQKPLVRESEPDVLVLSGYHVQSTRHVAPEYEIKNVASDVFRIQWVKEFWSLAEKYTEDTNILEESRVTAFWKTLTLDRDLDGNKVMEPTDKETLGPCLTAYIQSIAMRKFFLTDQGDMGLGPYETQQGDLICLLPCAVVPFVLRKQESEHFTLVGECYCHSLMEGGVVGDLGTKYKLREFRIR